MAEDGSKVSGSRPGSAGSSTSSHGTIAAAATAAAMRTRLSGLDGLSSWKKPTETPPIWINPAHLPPHGVERPPLNRILDCAAEREAFLGLKGRASDDDVASWRDGLSDLVKGLSLQADVRAEKKDRECDQQKARASYNARQKCTRRSESMTSHRPAWTYCDHASSINDPTNLLAPDGSQKSVHIPHVDGMYKNGWHPPHHEFNVHGMWNNHTRNDHGEECGSFKEKPQSRLGPTERGFRTRLDRRIAEAREGTHKDAMRQTDGVLKREDLCNHVPGFSALVRSKPVWVDQQISTHVYFSTVADCNPGDRHYETGLDDCVTQAARALSFERDLICGAASSKSSWRPPPRPCVGTARKCGKAARLLHSPARKRTAEAAAVAREKAAFGLKGRTASAPALIKGHTSDSLCPKKKTGCSNKSREHFPEPAAQSRDTLADLKNTSRLPHAPGRATVVFE